MSKLRDCVQEIALRRSELELIERRQAEEIARLRGERLGRDVPASLYIAVLAAESAGNFKERAC